MQPTEPNNPEPTAPQAPDSPSAMPGNTVSPTPQTNPQLQPAAPSVPPGPQPAWNNLESGQPAAPSQSAQPHSFSTFVPPTQPIPQPAPTPPTSPLPQEPLYPTPTTGPLAPAPSASSPPDIHICRNPFKNIAHGFPKFARSNLITSIIAGIVIFGGGTLLAAVITVALTGSVFFSSAGDDLATQASNNLAGIVFAIILIIFLSGMVYLVGYLVQSKLLVDGVRGHRTNFSGLLSSIKRVWIPLVWMLMVIAIYAVFGLLTIGLPLLTDNAAFAILSVVFGIGFLVTAIVYLLKWTFAFFVVVDDTSLGPIATLKRSAQLTNGYKLNIFLTSFGAGILMVIILAALNPGAFKPGVVEETSGVKSIISDVLIIVLSLLVYIGFAELYRQIHDSQLAVQNQPSQQSTALAPAPPPSQTASFDPTRQ